MKAEIVDSTGRRGRQQGPCTTCSPFTARLGGEITTTTNASNGLAVFY